MPETPPYDALIFDCDGTLADTMPAHFLAWTATLGSLGIDFDERRFYDLAGVPPARIVQMLAGEVGLDVDAQQIADQKEALFHQAIAAVLPIDPVVEIVRAHHGVLPLAVASGSPRWSVEAILRHVGIIDLFDVLICCGDSAPKPSPEPFLAAAARLRVAPDRCCVYEDSDLGLQAAAAAGMDAVDVRPWYASARPA